MDETLKTYALKGGITTVVSETIDSYPVGGIGGVLDFLDFLRDQPMKFFATAPSMVSISRAAAIRLEHGGKRLMAYAAAGAASCHEPITADEVPERHRLDMHVMIREGSIRAFLKPISTLKVAVAELGVAFPDPILSLVTLTGAAIPYLRICEEGLVNLRDGKTVGVVVEEGEGS